jgi:hypothetical protein
VSGLKLDRRELAQAAMTMARKCRTDERSWETWMLFVRPDLEALTNALFVRSLGRCGCDCTRQRFLMLRGHIRSIR